MHLTCYCYPFGRVVVRLGYNVKCFACFPVYERGIDACIHKEPAYPDVKLL